MCQKSTAHEQRRSRGESRKLRFGSNRTAPKIWQEGQHDLHSPPQPIDWREHTIGLVHDRNFYKKPTSTRKLRKFPVTSCQGSKHRDWTASRWWARWRSQSSSCQHHVITWRGLIPADHEYLDSVAWPCHDCEVAPVWHHDVTNGLTCQFFRRLFDRLPVRISTSDLHHRILRKKLYHIRAYDFGVQFSFKVAVWSQNDKKMWFSQNWNPKNGANVSRFPYLAITQESKCGAECHGNVEKSSDGKRWSGPDGRSTPKLADVENGKEEDEEKGHRHQPEVSADGSLQLLGGGRGRQRISFHISEERNEAKQKAILHVVLQRRTTDT